MRREVDLLKMTGKVIDGMPGADKGQTHSKTHTDASQLYN